MKDETQIDDLDITTNGLSLESEKSDKTQQSDEFALATQSAELLDKIVAETDVEKIKDLSYLFNLNQNKKTMKRVDACNDVLDSMLKQWSRRVNERPDEMSHEDLLKGIKVIQELMERGQRQVAEVNETEVPLIQINQQNNEVNLGDGQNSLSKDSRTKIQRAILEVLGQVNTIKDSPAQDAEVKIIEETEDKEDD